MDYDINYRNTTPRGIMEFIKFNFNFICFAIVSLLAATGIILLIETIITKILASYNKCRSVSVPIGNDDSFRFEYNVLKSEKPLYLDSYYDKRIMEHITDILKHSEVDLEDINVFMGNPFHNFQLNKLKNKYDIRVKSINGLNFFAGTNYTGKSRVTLEQDSLTLQTSLHYKVEFPSNLILRESYNELMKNLSFPRPIKSSDDAKEFILKYLNSIYPGKKFVVIIESIEIN
jgi:hypothetical protein